MEQNIEDGRWQSALALALTLPDICGGIAFPEIVKRYRDGRVMLDRQKNPTRDVGGQYIRWFDTYAGDYFKLSPGDERPYICGERCWQLRCEYLHQNKGFVNDGDGDEVRFHLGVNCGTSVCQMEREQMNPDGMDIRIDIEQFCLRMCRAAGDYYAAVHTSKDFSLYNTPVLDFIQASAERKSDEVIALVCPNGAYGRGLMRALESVSERVRYFSSPQQARRELGKGKPDLWIVTGEMMRQPDQPWRADRTTPVILLAPGGQQGEEIVKTPGRLRVLPQPILPETLRQAVRDLIREVE